MDIISRFHECFVDNKQSVSGFRFFMYTDLVYIGVDSEGIPTVLCKSTRPTRSPMCQKTRKLSIESNVKLQFELDGVIEKSIGHIIRCYCNTSKERDVFLELCPLFETASVQESQEEALLETVDILTSFFADSAEPSDIELQGLFAELFTILDMSAITNLGKYWQSKQKMTFDFSLTDVYKVEVKSTIKNERKHHFRHEQLVNDPYEVYVVSYLMRRDDEGFSLFDLIQDAKPYLQLYPQKLLVLDRYVKNTSEERLRELRYNVNYMRQKRKVFRTVDIPRFKEGTPDGVTNTEYDCNLDLAKELDLKVFESEIKEIIERGDNDANK